MARILAFDFGKVRTGIAETDELQIIATGLTTVNTKEIFIKLTSDYPGTTFNDTQGIMIDRKSSEFKSLQRQNRKQFGLGLNIGMGVLNNGQLGPYLGIGVSWNPKLLQW